MPISIKTDAWYVKDSEGNYRDSAIFSTTLPEEAASLIEDTSDLLDAQRVRGEGIVADTAADIDTIAAAVASMAQLGTDPTLTVTGMAADAKACGDLKSATNYEYSQLNTDLGRTVQLINRFDASTAVVGRVNSSGVGVDSTVTAEFTSDFIDVSDLTEIAIGRYLSAWTPTNVYYCLYNVSKNPIGTRTIGTTITVTGAYFIRFSGVSSNKANFMLVNSNYTPTRYVAYDRKVLFDFSNLHEKVDKLGLSQINERNTTFFEQSENLYNKATSEADTRLDGDGTATTGNGYTTSDYINVFGISSVTFYNVVTTPATVGVYYCFYNESKQIIGSRQIASSDTVPSGAVYLRVSINSTKNDVFMVVDSTFTPTQYLEYGYRFKYNNEAVHINPTDDVIKMLIENAGKDIVFDDGEYDIIDIYEDKYGSDYFTNYTNYSTSNVADRGLPILKGTKVRFSQGAYFTAEYTGNNTNVPGYFAAFALESDVTIDGLRLHTSRVRSPIHDDFGNFSSGTTIIKNCHITSDKVVVAGGLGQHDNVIIENNYFATTRTGNYDISYHNSSIANAQSNMIICNNYFGKGIRIAYYGTTEEPTDVLISNNSMAYDVTFEAETESSTVVNMSIKKWNNEIRS